MSAVTGKIVLSNSTKVSLHDRFTKLAKTKPTVNRLEVATARSRNLALQMEKRPTVQAALNDKKTLNQRMGSRIDSSRIGALKKNIQLRKGPQQMQKPFRNQRLPNQGPVDRSNKQLAINRVGPRGGIGLKNRIKFLKTNNLKQKLKNTAIKSNLVKKNQPKNSAKAKKTRGAAAAKPVKDKESLDNDLDKYMAKSKNALDNDLDTYMAQQ